MNYFDHKHFFKLIFLIICSLFVSITGHAQFTITENFKGSSTGSNIILGGKGTGKENAYLTSGNNYGSGDPVNQGWLRLTEAVGNRAGYAYIDKSFPATMGVSIEFEYKAWRNNDDTFQGADGFSVFLFNATSSFNIGGYGGSLGYANYNNTSGLAGAYLGIGIDEYGNFATPGDGRNGGVSNLQPNSITLRGSEKSKWKYLTSYQLQTSPSNNGDTSMDWNTTTSTRPTDSQFYRKVKILITPTGTTNSPKYHIAVYWTTTPGGAYQTKPLLEYDTTEQIPDKLKLGFAASTGGGFNYHEIRNVLITTPGNVRVQKSVDYTSQTQYNDLTYTISVTNDSGADLSGILLNDTIKDGLGNTLSPNDFQIKSITFNNDGYSANTATGFTSGTAVTSGFSNPLTTTTLKLAKSSTVSFKIIGTIKTIPKGGVINNSVGIDPSPSGITDVDLTNNYSTVSTTVLNPNVDLKVEKGVDNHGRAKLTGNVFTIQVTNISSGDKPANTTYPVTVTDTIPAGLTVTNYTGKSGTENGWTATKSSNIYTFTRTDELKSQFAYPNIIISVTPDKTHSSWTNKATLIYSKDTNLDNNSSNTILKWYNYWYGTNGSDWSVANNWTANFVPEAGWNVEFATTDNNSGDDGNGKGKAINHLYLDAVNQNNSGGRIIGNLINNSDQNLVITAGNQLIINGIVADNNPSAGTIVVKADPENKKTSGTLIFTNPTNNTTVGATVEFYNKAYDCADCGYYRKSWQYFGIPIQSGTLPLNDVTGNETVNQWVESFKGNKWQAAPYTPDSELKAFKGYEITNSSKALPTEVYSFNGILNTSNATVSLTKTANVNYSGTNLIANSYTAAIPIKDGITADITDKTVYLFNTGTRDQWRKLNGSTASGLMGGQYLAVPINLAGQEGIPSMIPSTHAFMVIADKATSLVIDYSKLVKNQTITDASGSQIATRSIATDIATTGTTETEAVQKLPSIVIDVLGQGTADRIWIFSKENTTYGFDSGWDGHKMTDEGLSQLYVSAADSSKLQVATVPSMDKVEIGFVPATEGQYTLEFAMSDELGKDQVFLNDLLTGDCRQIKNGATYTFDAKVDQPYKRFSLSYKKSSTAFTTDEALIDISVTDDGMIKITNSSKKSCTAQVSNVQGMFLQQVEVKANGEEILKSITPGTYIVRLENATVNDVRKVIVKKSSEK